MRSYDNSDPYNYLNDTNSALTEYYKLKQMLCLTDEERYTLDYKRPYDVQDSQNVISRFIEYINDKGITIGEAAACIRLHRVTLNNIILGRHQPKIFTIENMRNFLIKEGIL